MISCRHDLLQLGGRLTACGVLQRTLMLTARAIVARGGGELPACLTTFTAAFLMLGLLLFLGLLAAEAVDWLASAGRGALGQRMISVTLGHILLLIMLVCFLKYFISGF